MRNAIHELVEQLGEWLAIATIKSPQKAIKGTLKSYIPRPLHDTVLLGEDIAIALNNSSDFVFGLRPDECKRFIGDTEVDFNDEEIIIKGKRYKVTNGLLNLLIRSDVKTDDYNENELEKYKEILIRTNAMYQHNNPSYWSE